MVFKLIVHLHYQHDNVITYALSLTSLW